MRPSHVMLRLDRIIHAPPQRRPSDGSHHRCSSIVAGAARPVRGACRVCGPLKPDHDDVRNLTTGAGGRGPVPPIPSTAWRAPTV